MTTAPFTLSVTRFIAAPPQQVWAAMFGRLTEWWCPRPWQTEVIELDLRAGGRSAMVMRGPNGEESPMEGVVLEYVPNTRFVFTDAFQVGWVPQPPAFMVGIFALEAEGDGTRYTATARHWTEAAMEEHRAMGFEEGWTVVMEQLAALVE